MLLTGGVSLNMGKFYRTIVAGGLLRRMGPAASATDTAISLLVRREVNFLGPGATSNSCRLGCGELRDPCSWRRPFVKEDLTKS